jgi:AraC-like DNA-binding protein
VSVIAPHRWRESVKSRITADGVEFFEATYHTHTFDRHIHDTYAVGVTLTGVQQFSCRGRRHEGTRGCVLSIAPGDAHDGNSGTGDPYSYRMIYVPLRLVQRVLDDACERPVRATHFSDAPLFHDPRLAQSVSRAWASMDRAPVLDAAAEFLYEPIVNLSATMGGLRLPAESRVALPALLRVKEFLHANLDRDVKASELASLAGLSRFVLTRQFKRMFGLPIHGYHLHLRLQESRRRLRGGAAIADVAAGLGFSDQSHFNHRFKGAFGITPAQWRQAAQPYKTPPPVAR